jgi:hypothetical protein
VESVGGWAALACRELEEVDFVGRVVQEEDLIVSGVEINRRTQSPSAIDS